jgi:hypothetical protein
MAEEHNTDPVKLRAMMDTLGTAVSTMNHEWYGKSAPKSGKSMT